MLRRVLLALALLCAPVAARAQQARDSAEATSVRASFAPIALSREQTARDQQPQLHVPTRQSVPLWGKVLIVTIATVILVMVKLRNM